MRVPLFICHALLKSGLHREPLTGSLSAQTLLEEYFPAPTFIDLARREWWFCLEKKGCVYIYIYKISICYIFKNK